MKDNEIYVTGIGVVSAFGDTIEDFEAGLRLREKMLGKIDHFEYAGVDHPTAISAKSLQVHKDPHRRIVYLGENALKSALNNWSGDISRYKKIGFVLGSGLGFTDQLYYIDENNYERNYLSTLAEQISKQCNLQCESIYIGNACCAGSQAISYGMDLLEMGSYDLIIAGGIDILSQMAYAGFTRLNSIDPDGCRPFDKNRKGISVGEGAVFFILEKQSSVNGQQIKKYCNLAGSGITNDAYHIVQMKKSGEGIKNAISSALHEAQIMKNEVDLVIAHGTGTLLNDKVESQVLTEYFGSDLENMLITNPKGSIGHTGGASGAFGLLMAIISLNTGIVEPIANLKEIDPDCKIPVVKDVSIKHNLHTAIVNAFAFGGTNVVLVCRKAC
ncbi:MAG: beta-ketoacyl-[acyl-carrier-protein] synthase family protein [Bacillota bacterium]